MLRHLPSCPPCFAFYLCVLPSVLLRNTLPSHATCVHREYGVVSYTLLLALVEFKTLVMRGDTPAALALLPQLPKVSCAPWLCGWEMICVWELFCSVAGKSEGVDVQSGFKD